MIAVSFKFVVACGILVMILAAIETPVLTYAVANSGLPSLNATQTLTSPNEQSFGQFGMSVATDGNIAIVGAGIEIASGLPGAGHAYVFDTSTGQLTQTLTSPNVQAHGFFGFSVAASGNLVIVGAIFETVGGLSYAGRAYVFNGLTGSLVQTLTSPNPQRGGYFGFSVGVSGNTAIVGAPQEASRGLNDAGNVYVFNAVTGALLESFSSPSPQFFGLFGDSVSIGGSVVAIGAPYENSTRQKDAGNAYVFSTVSGSLLQVIPSPKPLSFGFFGTSVSTNGDLVVVGAPSQPSKTDQGSAYVFKAATGGLVRVLASPNAARGGEFGQSVSIRGGIIAVGAPGETVSGQAIAGRAYLYGLQGGAPVGLTSSNVQYYGFFGESVGVSGNYAIVGANTETVGGHSLAGRAYLFKLP